MTVVWISHAASEAHATPEGHPERIERIAAVAAGIDRLPLERREAPLADEADVLRCHPQAYLDRIRAAEPAEGIRGLDPDTWMSPGSFEAAMRAVGGTCAAVDLVLAGEASSAFVGCRPPGHHAERERPMGFCLFGSAAIAAKRALDHHGLGRVAVVDFDVHHGNGTQDLLWDESRALFVSSHQMPLYPGTGAADERGAHGQILNLPLAPGSGSAEMRAAWEEAFRRIEDWQPELILISAGFDAHAADPLANLNWREADFAWLTGRLCDLAAASCGGRVVSTLEGGYDLAALAASSAAHVGVLLERSA
ncbi:histone deacetylase family protein [Cereibacter sphaeroides]|uniref:histone deacetylase family protein n=1 Tax=Cereibacter sphaeroides TaxID=1063 RepID=UPI000191C84E|nr:histone deacetylase family protein [Cereibacter sphaeroides]ACM02393.1 Histone deacetylase superfamily [Cereibacter sphaeroides KD131]